MPPTPLQALPMCLQPQMKLRPWEKLSSLQHFLQLQVRHSSLSAFLHMQIQLQVRFLEHTSPSNPVPAVCVHPGSPDPESMPFTKAKIARFTKLMKLQIQVQCTPQEPCPCLPPYKDSAALPQALLMRH